MGVAVLDRRRDAHPDAVEGVDHVDEPAEADLGVPVDPQPGVLLDGLHEQLRATDRVRRVDLVRAVPGDRHVGVAGQRDQHRLPGRRRVHEHDRVRALTTDANRCRASSPRPWSGPDGSRSPPAGTSRPAGRRGASRSGCRRRGRPGSRRTPAHRPATAPRAARGRPARAPSCAQGDAGVAPASRPPLLVRPARPARSDRGDLPAAPATPPRTRASSGSRPAVVARRPARGGAASEARGAGPAGQVLVGPQDPRRLRAPACPARARTASRGRPRGGWACSRGYRRRPWMSSDHGPWRTAPTRPGVAPPGRGGSLSILTNGLLRRARPRRRQRGSTRCPAP